MSPHQIGGAVLGPVVVWQPLPTDELIAACAAAGVRLPSILQQRVRRRHLRHVRQHEWLPQLHAALRTTDATVTAWRAAFSGTRREALGLFAPRAAVIALDAESDRSGRAQVGFMTAAEVVDAVLSRFRALRPATVPEFSLPADLVEHWRSARTSGADAAQLRSVLSDAAMPRSARDLLSVPMQRLVATGAVQVAGRDGVSSLEWIETRMGCYLVADGRRTQFGPGSIATLRAATMTLVRASGRSRPDQSALPRTEVMR